MDKAEEKIHAKFEHRVSLEYLNAFSTLQYSSKLVDVDAHQMPAAGRPNRFPFNYWLEVSLPSSR